MIMNIRSSMRTRDHWLQLAWQTNHPRQLCGQVIRRNFKRKVKREVRLVQREFVEEQKSKVSLKTIKTCQTNSTDFWAPLGNLRPECSTPRLARKLNYVPAQDPVIQINYPVTEQFFFTTVECSQAKDMTSSMPNNKAPGILFEKYRDN